MKRNVFLLSFLANRSLNGHGPRVQPTIATSRYHEWWRFTRNRRSLRCV